MSRRAGSASAVGLPVLRDAAAEASDTRAAHAAHFALAAGGSATDAVIAGFFAAAGAVPSVLLGSAVAIVSNVGSGVRAFDGRPLQPGKGAARPRGYLKGVHPPDAAFLAVPRAVPLLMLLHAYGGRTGFGALARYGVETAGGADAKKRAKILQRVGAAGAIALRAEGINDALLTLGNGVAGGALTEEDLNNVLPGDAEAIALGGFANDAHVSVGPWNSAEPSDDERDWDVDVVAAADFRGNLAVLSYAHQPKGVALPDVELAAPRAAVPVMRGVTRVSPEAPLCTPGLAAIARFGKELALAFGLAKTEARFGNFGAELNVKLLAAIEQGASVEEGLRALAEKHSANRCVAALRTQGATRACVVVAR